VTSGPHIYSVPAAALALTQQDIVNALGYAESPVPEYLPDMIDEAMAATAPFIDVRCGYRVYTGADVSLSRDAVACAHASFSTGRIITTRLRNTTSLAVFAATIGPGVETESRRLMAEGDDLTGFIYDTIASAYTEAAAEWVEHTISRAAAADNEKITNRYSPGYCNWRVAEQHALFSLLPPGFLGIALTESALMLPVKSVSGIIGIGTGVKREQYQCSVCDMGECIRKKFTTAHAHASH